MGVEYDLVDHRNRRQFLLGKAYFLSNEFCRGESYRPAKSFEEFVSRFERDEDCEAPRFAAILGRLYAFCVEANWDVSILDDSDDGWLLELVLGYRYVDSVYGCSVAGEHACVVCADCGQRCCDNQHEETESDRMFRQRYSEASVLAYVTELRGRKR